jgi:excisionase family DNA binding protein
MELLVTPQEAAERLGLSRSTIYELIGEGRIHAVRIGRARRIPVGALADYVDRLVAEAADDEPTSGAPSDHG